MIEWNGSGCSTASYGSEIFGNSRVSFKLVELSSTAYVYFLPENGHFFEMLQSFSDFSFFYTERNADID